MPEWWEQDKKTDQWWQGDQSAESTTAVLEDPNEAYQRGFEAQDIAVDLELPIEYSEEMADVLDGQKVEKPGFLKRGFYGFVNKAIVQPFKNIISGGAIGSLDTELDALSQIRKIKEETGRDVGAEEFAEIMAKARGKVTERIQKAKPDLALPPAEGKLEKGLEIVTGVSAFVTKLAIARRFVGGSGATAEIAAFEAVNIADNGTPGMGVLLASSLGLVGKIPVATTLGKAGKLAGQGGVLAGITAAEGGSPEDIAVAFILPSMLSTLKQFPHLVRGKAFEAKIAKDVKAKGYSAQDAKNVAKSVRDAAEVRGGRMSPKDWGAKHGKNLNDIRAKHSKAVDTITKRTTPEKAIVKAKRPPTKAKPAPEPPSKPITTPEAVEVAPEAIPSWELKNLVKETPENIKMKPVWASLEDWKKWLRKEITDVELAEISLKRQGRLITRPGGETRIAEGDILSQVEEEKGHQQAVDQAIEEAGVELEQITNRIIEEALAQPVAKEAEKTKELTEAIEKYPGTLTVAVKLKNGQIIADSKVGNHGELVTKHNISPDDIADGGFTVGGKYISSITDAQPVAKAEPTKVEKPEELAKRLGVPIKIIPKGLRAKAQYRARTDDIAIRSHLPKGFDKDAAIAHELGHRAHTKIGNDDMDVFNKLVEEFRQDVNKNVGRNITYFEEKGNYHGYFEAFAELYGRYFLGKELPNNQFKFYFDEVSPIPKGFVKPKLKAEPTKVEPAPLKKPVTVSGKEYHPQTIPVESIGVDPKKFQFKLGAKLAGGVTEALKAVEKYDPVKAGEVLVWQDKEGKYWVIDGHHRVALARKTGQETMDAWVVREADGWTAEDARATGALRNLADGKGTAVDAAKLFRDSKITLEQLRKEGVPTNNTIVQQGMEMKDLSDEVFRLVVDERLPANMAAAIGREVKGPTQQKQVADLILEGEIETVRQAEFLGMTIDTAPVLTKKEQTLFGVETTEKSLYAERAKILANVENKLKTNKKVFGTLAKQSGLIESKGNILDRIANMETKEMAEEVLYMLDKFANAKGEVAEALNEATKEYAKYPTKDNLTKITNDLVQKWTEATTGLTVQNIKGLFGAPTKGIEQEIKPKGKAGKLDITPLQNAFDMFMSVIEPSKAVEIKLGKEVYATVIKGVHKADVARIEFNEEKIENMDRSLREFGESLAKYPKKVLQDLMLSRGKPHSPGAIEIRDQALKDLAKEAPELVGTRKMITKIADFNYKYLTDVAGDKIHYVEDYFYGIYKDPGKVERFIQYWKTTKRFTKEKKLPTVADAVDYGLELRDYNPVNNLMSEYMAIARLDGMIEMRDALMKTGEDKYISKDPDKIADPDKISEPVFKGLWLDKDLARMIKKLISTNKVTRVRPLNALRITNNFLRNVKFLFSLFHQMSIIKHTMADSGYLGFLYKPTAYRFVTTGFRKDDPMFQEDWYKKYIGLGGGHRYSIASEAERAFVRQIQRLTKSGQLAVRIGTAPLKIPENYVKWLFESYIPKIKALKYRDHVFEKQKKLGRELTDAEHIDIIKEGQNIYGMMNERLFGRSGTVTTLMRFKFMAPGFAEGNFRQNLKALLQWGQEGTFRAGRSRADILNSFLLTAIGATIGTLILTGKPPKKPEQAEDIRDLFKIDTGEKDLKGRKIMIDLMTYDKDFWMIFGKPFVGQAGEVPRDVFRRLGGMTATTWEVISDLNQMSMGNSIYDWNGNRVVEVTDPFAKRVTTLIAHETQKMEPISVNVFQQSRQRGLDRLTAAITTLLGARPTTSEKDKRESKIINRIFSLRDRQERLYYFLGTIKNPREHIDRYNKIAQSILDNPITTEEMREKWGENLIIDTERLVSNKVHAYELAKVTDKPKPDELEKLKKWLTNFGITKEQYRKQLTIYEMKHRKLILEMKDTDADELLKNEIAKFYAYKGILDRKVKDGSATDTEKRQSRKYSKISSNISEIGTLIHKTIDVTKRKRYYERVRNIIERTE